MRQPVAPADVQVFRGLADRAALVDGNPTVGDAVYRDLRAPSPTSALILAYDGDEPIGGLHYASHDNVVAPRHTIAVVVDPTRRSTGVARTLIDTAIELAEARGGGLLELLAFGSDAHTDRFAAAVGFELERELWQMRVALPLPDEPRWPPGIDVRAFVPGQDEPAWLVVNNRAFRDDPDQGHWAVPTLLRREAEPWFDPQGFLLAFDAHGLAGFCWTKIHAPAPPSEPEALGEIYVIGVDPDRQGTGLGRALVVGGLASLHDRGTATGMLFVDAHNDAAVGLYRALGFDVTRVDRAYTRPVPSQIEPSSRPE